MVVGRGERMEGERSGLEKEIVVDGEGFLSGVGAENWRGRLGT